MVRNICFLSSLRNIARCAVVSIYMNINLMRSGVMGKYLQLGSAFELLLTLVTIIRKREFLAIKNEPAFLPRSELGSHFEQVTTTRGLVNEYVWAVINLVASALNMLT